MCEYIEEEEAHLKEDLLAHPLGIYNQASATAGGWVGGPLVEGVQQNCSAAERLPRGPTHPLTHPAERCRIAPSSPCAEAKGVVSNRLQNVVITLDKVKMVLAADKQV